MAPIPVYSASPVNAAQPSGVTPKTAPPGGVGSGGQDPQTTGAGNAAQAHPAAQPGATPSLPKQTGVPQASKALPTPTRSSSVMSGDPPAPQPGAVPVPPSYTGSNDALPPPPKAGSMTTMPPQMGYQPPQASLPIQGRSSTSTTAPHIASIAVGPSTTSLQGHHPPAGYSPAAGGYQQGMDSAGYNYYQQSATENEEQNEASVWNTAKKWAASAGESLAAAENKIWKQINKN